MPHSKVLFATGCVAQATVNRNRASLTLYFDKTEIMGLDPYFTDAITTAILAETASTVVPASAADSRLRMTSKSVRVKSLHRLHRLKPGAKRPDVVPPPHPIDDGCFYWLRSLKRASKR